MHQFVVDTITKETQFTRPNTKILLVYSQATEQSMAGRTDDRQTWTVVDATPGPRAEMLFACIVSIYFVLMTCVQ